MNKYSWLVRQVKKNIRALDSGKVLLWSHLGLGDQISASRLVEELVKQQISVVWPVKQKNFDFLKVAFADVDGLSLVKINDNTREDFQVTKISIQTGSRVVSLGHSHLSAMHYLFPEYSLNSLFNLFVGMDPLKLVSLRLRDRISRTAQLMPPTEPFAFLDHHPGTVREIPQEVLSALRERGLRLVDNPRDAPLYSTVRLLDSAQEIHLVNSAPLCLALTIDATAPVRINYDSLGDSVAKSYERWASVHIGASAPSETQALHSDTRAKDARLEILSLTRFGDDSKPGS
jgi:hypothetical protein